MSDLNQPSIKFECGTDSGSDSPTTKNSRCIIPTLYQSELMAMAYALAGAQELFMSVPPGSHKATHLLVTSLLDWFDALLPDATDDTRGALVELCVLELARAHLEKEADAGRLDSAQIIDINGQVRNNPLAKKARPPRNVKKSPVRK
jgi:hypothetical protein